ncbi:titin isoform X3 [Labeo rohita]|uniref:titin isoform X3 n=1 Tax=Labeo rohita TaxID=84645 RepID=UPI0021E2C76D|nr:titin isoform X3 [Labeo rohita]
MERFKIFLLTVAVSAQVTSQDSTDELPQAQIQSNWTEAFTGEKVSLQCVIQSVSTSLNYLWFKGSDKIVSSGEISINGNTLTLSVDSSRNGTYECQAELQGRNVTTAKPYLLRVKELPHPKLSIESKWKVFYPTEKVTLKCSIDEDSNEWGYEWFRNGNQLHEDISSSGNTLSISSAKAIQSGQYTCRGKHLTRPTVTTNQTEAVQLRIQDDTPKPTITKHQWFEFFYTEERVQLHCNMPGDGWEYHWHKDSNPLTTNPELTINSTSVNDTGVYHCKAQRGDFSVDSETVQVRVQKPPEPQIQSNWTEAFPGENVSLQCVIQDVSKNWNYLWFKNSSEISSGEININGNTLTLSVESSHNGAYECQAELQDRNVTTAKSTSHSLTVHGSQPTILLEQDPPYPEIYTGEQVKLSCRIQEQTSQWEYLWKKDSQQVNTDVNNSIYTIQNATRSQKGEYTCHVQRREMTFAKSTNLTIRERPEPKIQSNWTEAFTGEKVSLQCVIQDVSENWNYLWFKNSSEISSGEININGNTLTLSVESSHNGAYECQAKLQDRKVTTTKSTMHLLRVKELPQPKLSIESKWKVFYPTEKVTLNCSIDEDSNEWDYEWFRNGAQLHEDEDISFAGNTLSISSARANHSGQYTCRGKYMKRTSVTTNQTEAVQLHIQGITPKPNITKHQWFEFFYTKERVQLHCNMPGVGWEYHWYKDSKLWITNPELTIDSASVPDTGDFHCEAKRGNFSMDSETVQVRVQKLPQPKLSIESKWKVFYPTEKVTLNCSIDEDSNEWDYEWFRNGVQLNKDEDISSSGNTLSISSAKASHSGQYTCRGKHLMRTSVTTNQTEAVHLHIQNGTPKPNITKHKWFKFFYTEEQVQLHCNMPGDGWEYHWHKDSNPLTTNPALTINSTSVSDTGDFHCKAKRGDFSVDSETVQVRVQKPPEPQIQSDWTEAFHGENVSLQCVIQDASKKWNYLWFTDSDKIVSSGERSIKGNTLTLTIESSHNGAYVCQAELQDRNVTTEKSAAHSLTVHERPQPKLSLESQWNIFYPTEKVTLKCSVDKDSNEWGYEWFKNKAPLHGDKDVSLSGNTLFISSAKASHSGQYTCGGKYMKRTSVTTNQTEAVHLQINDNTPKPNITKHVWFELLYTDEQVQLHCEMQGVGWEYHWYKGLNFRITNPTHTINSTTVADTGDYYCKAQRGDFSVDSETVQVRVEAHPPAFLNLETELSDIMTGEVTLRCNVSDGRQWNYTWYMNRQKLDESSDVLKVPGNEETIKSEFKCKGIRTERPLYSALSDGFTANNIIFKRKILLAISGCLVCCIVILIIGCIVLKITRKPGVKERATEDLFFSMKDSNNQIVSPMKEYMDDIPIELEECQETEELITDHASAIHEDGVIEDEETPASESNGLTSFKGVKDTAPEDLVLSVTDSKNQAVSPIKDIDNSPTELEECQEKEELITDCASAVHEDGVVIKGEETPASESNGLTSFKISLKGEETPASESNGLTSFKDEETPTSESNGLTSFKDKEKPASEANGLTSFKEL